MKPSETLIAARKLIERPENWMQGFYNDVIANDEDSDKEPSCFCSIGAIHKAAGQNPLMVADYSNPAARLLDMVVKENNSCWSVTAFNDSKSHSEVLDMFDKAIALAIEEESE